MKPIEHRSFKHKSILYLILLIFIPHCCTQTTYRLCVSTMNEPAAGTSTTAKITLQYANPEYNSNLLECYFIGLNFNEKKCCDANVVGLSRDFSKIWFSININFNNAISLDKFHLETINNGVTLEQVFDKFKCYNSECNSSTLSGERIVFCITNECGCSYRFYQRKWDSSHAVCSKGTLW